MSQRYQSFGIAALLCLQLTACASQPQTRQEYQKVTAEKIKASHDEDFCRLLDEGYREATPKYESGSLELYYAITEHVLEKISQSDLQIYAENIPNIASEDRIGLQAVAEEQLMKQKVELRNRVSSSNRKLEFKKISGDMFGCANTLRKKDKERAERLSSAAKSILNPIIRQEKETFMSRSGGRQICADQTLSNMLAFSNSKAPTTACLYRAYEDIIPISIKAEQVTSQGILAGSQIRESYPDLRQILIVKNGAVDSQAVDGEPIPQGLFEYLGPVTYRSLLGERTVWSFRRVDIANLFDGLILYNIK